MNVYYINNQGRDDAKIKVAFSYALRLAADDQEISSVVILIGYLNQIDTLSSIFSPKELKERCVSYRNKDGRVIGVRIETVQTYHPVMVIEGQPREIVYSVYVNPKHFEKFDAEYGIKYWVAIPWQENELKDWLIIHEGKDIETGAILQTDLFLDERVANAIE